MEYAAAGSRTYSIEEYAELPDEDDAVVELVGGMLVREPIPGPEHGALTVDLAAALRAHARRRGLGRVYAETGYILSTSPPTVRGPDVSFVAASRPVVRGTPGGYIQGAPDLAVEIVSPSNRAGPMQAKVAEYVSAGALLVWVVYPRSRTVAVHVSRTEVHMLGMGDALDGCDVLPGFRLPLADLFVD